MFPTKKSPKISAKFFCDVCNYKCCKPSEFDRHISTAKHKILQNPTHVNNNTDTYNCPCGKSYKHSSTLYAHKKKCVITNNSNNEENSITTNTELSEKDLIMMIVKQNTELIKENNEFKNMMMKVIENGGSNTNISNTTHTNSHNKAFNLNFFLNETCKDAMNIMDFVESIQLQLSDFENVGDIGFVNGISNIIVKNLKALDVTKRPVHCTDQKRETIYIKDDNKWEKEDDKKQKFRKFIKKVVSKNQRLMLKFKEVYPDYNKYSSPNSTRYDKIIIEALGGRGDNDIEKEDKIISNISKVIGLEKEPS